jgi:uncharacterized membrane protein
MRKDIRTRSLNESQKENEHEMESLIYQVLIGSIIIAGVNIGLGFGAVPINILQILFGVLMAIIIGYFLVRIMSVRNNIKNIENQISKLQDEQHHP